jgi:hypothetical protein
MGGEETPRDVAAAGGANDPVNDDSGLPRIPMLFSASALTFNVRVGRSGREESEGVILMGDVSYRDPKGERRLHAARAMIVKSDARKRLDLVLAPNEAVLTIPLEPFAMQRLQDKLKELIAGLGMTLRLAFSAADTPERQGIEAVDFAFSASKRQERSQQGV